MGSSTTEPPKVPAAWFKHLFWRAHRLAYRVFSRARSVDATTPTAGRVRCT